MARSKAIKKQVKHLLGIQNLSVLEAKEILKESQNFIKLNRSGSKKLDVLRGKTQINLFFEPSTRTQSSFDLAGKRLGADVMSMNIVNSAIKKGETLMDTAMTLNAMHPDLIVVEASRFRELQIFYHKKLTVQSLMLVMVRENIQHKLY